MDKRRTLTGVIGLFSLLSFGLVGATPTVAAAAASSAAGTSMAAISSHCSRATAHNLLIKLNIGERPEPVAQVLCGHFVGPNSNAMVVSLSTPGCGGSIGWMVLRHKGHSWHTVLTRQNGADLAAVGSRIRESQFMLRPGDAHCFPTGGTRSRLWRWNGDGLTHSGYRRTGAMFVSPSRSLWCVIAIASVFCQSTNQPHTALLGRHGKLQTCIGDTCFVMGSQPPNAKTLPYGRTSSVGAFRCQSKLTGMTCTVRRSGKGFAINQTGVTRVVP